MAPPKRRESLPTFCVVLQELLVTWLASGSICILLIWGINAACPYPPHNPIINKPHYRVTGAAARRQPELPYNLHLSLQVNSTEFISCKERVDQELMCLQPPNAVCVFYPISQATQGHPKARPLHHNPSGLKNSHQARLRVAVNHPGLAPCTPPTAQIPDDTTGTDECCDGFRPLHSEDVGESSGWVHMGGWCLS